MVDVPYDAIADVPPAEVPEVELYHPKSWWTKYVFSQDAKVIAIQYSLTAIGNRTGGAGAVVADAAAIGISRHILLYRCQPISPVHHHARHDHGDLPAHRVVPGGLRQLPYPADGRRPGHGVPLCEHAELLGLSARGPGAGVELLRAWRAHRRRLDAVPAPGHPLRHPRAGLGHHSDARLPDPVHHRLHHGRVELCGDGAAGAHARDDADAHAPDGMGHFHGHRHGAAGLPRLVRRLRHDAVRPAPGDQLLHAGPRRDGPAD